MNDGLIFSLPGAIVPKARPRFSNGFAYTEPKYGNWKQAAIASLQRQVTPQMRSSLPINEPVAVHILLTGKHNRAGDADNTSGSILDALVQAGILQKDNLTIVVELSVILVHDAKKLPNAEIVIAKFAAEV
jgi:Holliday junction resolvase RusA-like endonuclease